MKKIILMIIAIMTVAVETAFSQTVYAQTSIKCLGVELDGSQTLRVQGYGRNRSDAKEQAMKNAVWAVIFDGVKDGVAGCNTRPLVTECKTCSPSGIGGRSPSKATCTLVTLLCKLSKERSNMIWPWLRMPM